MTADTIETPLKKVELTADDKRKRLDDHYEAKAEAAINTARRHEVEYLAAD